MPLTSAQLAGSACLAKKLTDRKKKVHLVDREDNYSDDENVTSTLSTECNSIDQKMSSDIIWITPRVNGKLLRMELDTGSAVSVISKRDYETNFGNNKLTNTKITLKTYSGKK